MQLDNPPPQTAQDYYVDFRLELEKVINRYSMENGSDTPDSILAHFLSDCLRAWDLNVSARDRWYSSKRHTISGSDVAENDDL